MSLGERAHSRVRMSARKIITSLCCFACTGDFIITASSWWAHFLNMCRRAFSNWVSLSGFLARELLPFEGIVLPYKLLNAQVGSRSDTLLVLVSERYLFPTVGGGLFSPVV